MAHPSSGIVTELADMRSRAADLAETLWAAHDAHELIEVVAELEAVKATLDAVELFVVRELEATGGARTAGWASTQDFLTHASGVHKGSGPATVRLAAATAEPGLAPIAEAMRDGWLSTAQAQVIERAVDPTSRQPPLRARGVQVLLAEGKRLDATELKKVAARLVSVVDPDGDERPAATDRGPLPRPHLCRPGVPTQWPPGPTRPWHPDA